MPKREAEEFLEQPIPEQSTRVEARPIRVRVVYVGAKRNESVCLPGSVSVQHFPDKEGPVEYRDRETGKMRKGVQLRTPVEGGMSSYDFSTHNLKGQPIVERFVPSTDPFPERLRGKRFEWVEHPGHVAEFHLGPKDRDGNRRKGEFEVLAKPQDMEYVMTLVRMAQRRERRVATELKEVLT